MEQSSRYQSGPLHDLQRLEDAENSNGTSLEKHRLKQLEKEIQSLTHRRDQLKWRLERSPGKIIQRLLSGDKEQNERELASSDVYQAACAAVTAASNRKLQQTDNIYRLSGISVNQVKKNVVRLTFDTFNESNFFEPYYVEVKGSDNLTVGSHSLPHFIPVTIIAEKQLSIGLRPFAQSVMAMLSAFVARRQFIKDLQTYLSDHLVEEINCSKSYDFCCLLLVKFSGLQIQLMFPLEKKRPGQVKVMKLSKKSPELTESEQENLSGITKSLLATKMPDINLINREDSNG